MSNLPDRVVALKVLTASVLLAMSVTAEAQAPVPAAPVIGTPSPVVGGPPAAAPGAPRPYKDVIKDAKEIPGFFTLYQKDEKVWIAIKPEQFDIPFFFTYNIPQSVGERGLYASQMGGAEMAVFRKIGGLVQLIAKNTDFYARPGTPQAQFVAEGFSDSLLSSATIVSTPSADNKAVLVEANGLLFTDIPGYLTRLEYAYRLPFALDARNTSISRVNNNDVLTGMQVQVHFNVPKLSAPPLVPSPVPMPPPPSTMPDPRSLFVSFYYSFAKLPEEPMTSRIADERVGHFVTSRVDYSDDLAIKPKSHLINRWRLEKKDPAAALSEPKEPITYWIDKNVPEKYRKAVADGILEWNKAFEKIGFKDAIVVRQQTEKDGFDTMDARHASVRWFTGADVGFAIGPSHKDPRSGEILDADIGMSDVFARGARRLVVEDLGKPLVFDAQLAGAMSPTLKQQDLFMSCNYAAEKSQDLQFASDILEARGMDMGGPEAERLAQDYVKDVIMHEVGHTLGLRHNFRSSTIYSLKQIQDQAFTRVNGLAGSVMDYNPFNLAANGEKQGEYVMSTLGPYDYLAIEYAYKPLDPKNEAEELAKLAAQATTNPLLAYATDEDAGGIAPGIDPDVNRFDMGGDPLEYYKKRMKLTRELWDRIQTLQLKPGESYERLTRSFSSGFRQLAQVAPLAAKYVGGVRHLRDRAGTGHALYEPTPAAKQREALTLVTEGMFKVDSFRLKPEFVSRLSIDQFERRGNPDISIANSVLNLQKGVLDVLLADSVAQRLLDSQEKVANPASLMKLSDLYDTLQNAIWSELRTGGDISPMRRNLQREHLKRVANALIKPSAGTPADARSLQRENTIALGGQIRTAMTKPMSKEARAHLSESLNTLNEALKAPMQRAGV
ncbi:MAG TPA: zinc-dependent metalloprotease [Usitatibacteraceae bacterium]